MREIKVRRIQKAFILRVFCLIIKLKRSLNFFVWRECYFDAKNLKQLFTQFGLAAAALCVSRKSICQHSAVHVRSESAPYHLRGAFRTEQPPRTGCAAPGIFCPKQLFPRKKEKPVLLSPSSRVVTKSLPKKGC